jgi:HEAT repeat protein
MKKIEKKILKILKDAKRLNLLADEFRAGRDIDDLLALLNSDNEEIIEVGAWIAGEVSINPTDAGRLVPRLHHLVSHKSPSIRFYAIGALFPFLDAGNGAAKEMLLGLSNDPDKGVRAIACAALKRIFK